MSDYSFNVSAESPTRSRQRLPPAQLMSPCSTLAILAAESNIPNDTLREMVTSLVLTVDLQQREHDAAISSIRETLTKYEEWLAQYEECDSDDEPPEGYHCNDVHPKLTVVLDDNEIPIKWVRA